MKLSVRKRDVSVELMRIIACFFVICIHLGAGFFMNGSFSKSSTFLVCLFADAVAMFWFITGAFLLRRDEYVTLLKSVLKKVVLPTLGLIAFIFFFNGWMFDGMSIVESIKSAAPRFFSALECVFVWWATPVAHTGQLWYIFAYVFVMICFPVIKSFSERIEKKHKEKLFLVISFGILLLNDVSNNHFANFSHTVIGAFIPAVIIIMWGHIIYRNKDKILRKLKARYFFLAFIVLNIIRAMIMVFVYHCGDSDLDKSIIYWFSCFGVLTVSSVFLFLEGTVRKATRSELINWLIIKIGSYTFIIYLLHELVIDYMKKIGFLADLKYQFLVDTNILKTVLYYVLLGGIVFIICLLIGIFLRFVSTLSKIGYRKLLEGVRR